MKKIFLTFLLISTVFTCQQSYAQNLKIITLKDGSIIKGTVVGLSNGEYSVQTSFGTIQVEDTNIASISTKAEEPANTLLASDDQMAQYEQQILGNPQVLSEIQTIIQDPEIQATLSDPAFAQAVMAKDLQKIQNNPKFQKLLANPKMQELIGSASQIIK
ncbi:MAG: hypothetical protein PHY73_05720 [Candidatus Omnitrophica bacterium]|nr:hypothetical protein [Candidatus Omnitrophota bacterium]